MVYISFRYEIDEEQIAAKLRGIDISLISICFFIRAMVCISALRVYIQNGKYRGRQLGISP
jgi:hypothetical protein